MTYKRLTDMLDGYWEKPWSQLPKEQRQAWHEALGAIGDEDGKLWDGHNVQWRKGVAESHDYAQDPANAPEIKAGIRLGYWSVVARNFGAPKWKDWLDLPSWTPREAACLIFELNPDRYEPVASNIYPEPRGLIEEIVSIERKAIREQQAGLLRERPSPDEWAKWAQSKGFALSDKWHSVHDAAKVGAGKTAVADGDIKEKTAILDGGAWPKAEWVQEAWKVGTEWMLAEEIKRKERPGIVEVAKYVEGEFKRRDIRSKRLDDYLDWQTIKKEITGITERNKGDNFKSAMGNPQRKKHPPNVKRQ